MIKLNLTATTKEHQVIKDYLENNVSEALAEKINNGVKVEKDGKTLINKKDLRGFMDYACGEARKQAEKTANGACVMDTIVFGWAIHYFEENSIEGKLYSEDGTEYKPPKPVYKPAPASTHIPATPYVPKPKPQMSMFDFSGATETPEQAEPDDEPDAELTDEPDADEQDETPSGYTEINNTQCADADGVVHDKAEIAAMEAVPNVLYELAGAVKVRCAL